MKYRLLFILAFLALLSCNRQRKEPSNQPVTANDSIPVVEQKAEADVDAILVRIHQIIKEEFADRNLVIEMTKSDEDALEENLKNSRITMYSYRIPRYSYSLLRLSIRKYSTNGLAKKAMKETRACKDQMIANDELVKIAEHYFRINNNIYSFFCTANIDHIRGKIYRRIIEEMNIKEEDTECL